MNREIILGGPGAGKTTELVNRYRDALIDGVHPNDILLITYTRKARHEIRRRIAEEFGLEYSDLDMIRTFHSFLWTYVLRWSMALSLKKEHLEDFGRQNGYTFRFWDKDVNAMSVDTLGGTLYYLQYLMRVFNLTEKETWDRFMYPRLCPVRPVAIKTFSEQYTAYKETMGLKDYQDCIENVITSGRSLGSFHTIMIDEAQDLTGTLWQLLPKIEESAQNVIFAGDDDQSIYTFGGADVKSFLTLTDAGYTKTVLPRSHRMPRAIYDFSQALIRLLGDRRYTKEFAPKEEGGKIGIVSSLDSIDLEDSQRTFLLLAPTNYLAQQTYIEYLQQRGLPYITKGDSFNEAKDVQAIAAYEALQEGKNIDGKSAGVLYSLLPSSCIAHGFKKTQFDHKGHYDKDSLTRDFGYRVTNQRWEDVLMIKSTRINYLLKVGKSYSWYVKPWIEVATIHAAKGGEADVVTLMCDISSSQGRIHKQDKDVLRRLFYVAATRAKSELWMLSRRTSRFYDEYLTLTKEFRNAY